MQTIFLRKKTALLAILLLSCYFLAFSQKEKTKIKLIHAENMKYDANIGEDIYLYIGNVAFEHDSAFLYCDSAVFDAKNNSAECFENIHIKTSDNIDLYGDTLHYQGLSKIATIWGDVKLIDKKATLYSNKLIYNRMQNNVFYDNNGKIVDEENTLTSKAGHYNTSKKEFYFREDVVLINPKYNINSDTLVYNTKTKTTYFYGPTTIVSDSNTIYCNFGWYNTQTDISEFSKNASLNNKGQTLTGDKLFYDRNKAYGRATGNVILTDTLEDLVIKGGFGEYYENEEIAYFTDRAFAIMTSEKDSLFLHADTLLANMNGAEEKSILFAYNNVKFFRDDLQGMCDSLVYSNPDSTIYLYQNPVIWTDENQLSADSILIKLENNKINKMLMYGHSFVLSKDTVDNYNQLKGKLMTSYFKNNEIYRIDVEGNSETIFFIREDDGSLIGVNKSKSTDIILYVEDNKFVRIKYIEQPTSIIYPGNEIGPSELQLKGFNNLEKERPKTRTDIFL